MLPGRVVLSKCYVGVSLCFEPQTLFNVAQSRLLKNTVLLNDSDIIVFINKNRNVTLSVCMLLLCVNLVFVDMERLLLSLLQSYVIHFHLRSYTQANTSLSLPSFVLNMTLHSGHCIHLVYIIDMLFCSW